MCERFTDRARRVVVLAQEEARTLKHNFIGTEHLLLGLVHEGEGIAAQALDRLGISLEGVRSQVEEIIGIGNHGTTGFLPFNPRAKKVLELSLREALQLGHNYIGTEHLLLALLREGEGIGAQVLVKLGVELTDARKQVIQLISGYKPKEAPVEKAEQPTLEQMIRNIVRDEIKSAVGNMTSTISSSAVEGLPEFLSGGSWSDITEAWTALLNSLFGIGEAA